MQHDHDSVWPGVPNCAKSHKAYSYIDDCVDHTEISLSHLDSWPASSTHTFSTDRANNIMIQERCGCRWIWASSDATRDPLSPVEKGFVAVQTLGPTPSTNPTETLTWRKDGCPSSHLPWSLPFPENRIWTSRSMTPMNTLEPAPSAGRFRGRLPHHGEFVAFVVSHEAASPHANCNQLRSCARTPNVRAWITYCLRSKMTFPCKFAADLLFCRDADIQQLNNLSRSRSQ